MERLLHSRLRHERKPSEILTSDLIINVECMIFAAGAWTKIRTVLQAPEAKLCEKVRDMKVQEDGSERKDVECTSWGREFGKSPSPKVCGNFQLVSSPGRGRVQDTAKHICANFYKSTTLREVYLMSKI